MNATQLKEAIKAALERRYGELNDLGAYTNGNWLSTEKVFEIVCNVIDEGV